MKKTKKMKNKYKIVKYNIITKILKNMNYVIQNMKYKINKKIKKVMWYNLYDRILITVVIICKIYNILKIVIYKNNSNNKNYINNKKKIYIRLAIIT